MRAENSKWYGKKVLVIGDSITSDGRWQKEFARITGCEVATHARGGIGIIDMVWGLGVADSHGMAYDPTTGVNGEFHPLCETDVADKDLIIFLGAYNERHMEYGEIGDVWPRNDTLRGKFASVIERIFELLDKTDNLTCRFMLVTPHCVGKYDWVDADGYGEFPAGSGRSLETMANLIKDIAGEYNLPCCDAWHTSGINRFTWKVFANSPTAIRADFDPDAEYTAPYPQYADQAHMNDAGYARLGACIAAFAETV